MPYIERITSEAITTICRDSRTVPGFIFAGIRIRIRWTFVTMSWHQKNICQCSIPGVHQRKRSHSYERHQVDHINRYTRSMNYKKRFIRNDFETSLNSVKIKKQKLVFLNELTLKYPFIHGNV